MAANRSGTRKIEPESPKPNRLRFTKKPEKTETGETETAVLNRFPKFQMGTTGVPFGRTELLVPPPESPGRALARGKSPRVPGGWGVGKKLKNVSFLGHFVLNFSKKNEKVERNRSNSLGLGSD